jgi:hypothetical protein
LLIDLDPDERLAQSIDGCAAENHEIKGARRCCVCNVYSLAKKIKKIRLPS